MTPAHNDIALSVVLAVTDLDVASLKLAIASHRASPLADRLEIIVSDCGPKPQTRLKSAATALGCLYVHTKAAAPNRARALNAGLNLATGDTLMTMAGGALTAPEHHALAVERLRLYPAALQSAGGENGWSAFRRSTADRLRGYDETLDGAAANEDFATRVRLSGGPVHLIAEATPKPKARSRAKPLKNTPVPAGLADTETTLIRNLTPDSVYIGKSPLVSVVIATRNRAAYLTQSLASVLAQTFGDFEIIVVDDASSDDTAARVAALTDPRIRYLRLKSFGGVAVARNLGNRQARGHYIAVHDDDDLMLPHRLATQLAGITAGVAGSYGGWIDARAGRPDLVANPGRAPFSVSGLFFHGDVWLHPTLLIRRDIMLNHPYLESIRAGSDVNLAFRLARSGARLVHCGAFLTLRRLHDQTLTQKSRARQQTAALATKSIYMNGLTPAAIKALRAQSSHCLPVAISTDGLEGWTALLAGAEREETAP